MDFFGRARQKQQIHKLVDADGHSTMLVYGRRRIGKSELIKQCLRETEVRSIYYECKQTSEKNNVETLSEIISEEFGYPKLSFGSFEELLSFVFQKSKEEKIILVLDEYPYIRSHVKGMDSILQTLIDGNAGDCELKLIICGSYVDTMKSLLMEQNPLFGRVDLTIALGPMDYLESSLFYSEFSNEDKVRLYSVFGGIPYYNRLIDPEKSVRDNIIELIASTGARLENEVSMYLNSEIAKVTNANEVFEALAKGFSKYKDILDQSHVSSGPTLVDVLDKLMRMGLVKREAPINDESNRKKAGYHISDNLSLFYYKYIFRNLSRMGVMNTDVFYDRYIEEDFETKHVPHVFEEICRQYLINMNRAGKLREPFEKIGKYYYDDPVNKRNGEFDIVTLDDKGYIFYEAKFRKEPVTSGMIEEEIRRVQQTDLASYRYGFFSGGGFDCEARDDLILIGLDELYAN